MQPSRQLFVLLLCILVYSQPANDLCMNAIAISPSDLSTTYTFSGTTVSSNKEHSCPLVSTGTSAGDVWFYFTPTVNMLVDISLCGSSYNTYIFIASGSCASLSCLVASDDSAICSSTTRSSVKAFSMLQGVNYFIIISGSNGATGAYTLNVSKNPGSASCAGATTIPSLPYFSSSITLSATSPQSTPCRTGASAWFTFTPTSTVTVQLSTCASTLSTTYLSVASGSCPFGLTCIASSSQSPTGGCSALGISSRAYLTLLLDENIQYFFIVTVAGTGATLGAIRLSITSIPIENDFCSGAISIPALPFSITGETAGSTKDNICPSLTSTVRTEGDVWYSFTPTENVLVDVSLCGSLFDTYAYIASGHCSSLSCLLANDNSALCGTNSRSLVQAVSMLQDVTYFIIVSGGGGNQGTFTLNVNLNTGAAACSVASPISLPFAATPTLNAGSPQSSPCTTGASVWYSFTPSSPMEVYLSTCDSALTDTFISVVTGSCPNGLSCIASNADSPRGTCSATATTTRAFLSGFQLTANVQYYFIFSVTGSATGSISVFIGSLPVNENCSSAIPITSTALPYSDSGYTTLSTKDNTCRGVTSSTQTAGDVWYSITPTTDVLVDVSLCGSSFDTYLYISSGSCSSLSCLAVNDDSVLCSPTTRSSIPAMPMEQGITYFIIVSGSGSSKGAYTLSVSESAGSAGCTLANAIPSLPFTSPSLPISDSVRGTPCKAGASVWFTFTPTSTYGVSISACGSNFDTTLSVSSGACPFDLSCLASNDDSSKCGINTRSFINGVVLSENIQYFINVAQQSGDTGSGNVVLSIFKNNNFCDDATVINSLPFSSTGSKFGYAKNHNCVDVAGTPQEASDAWFSFTPTENMLVDVSHCEPSYDCDSPFGIILYITSGSCSSYSCLLSSGENICTFSGGCSLIGAVPISQRMTYFIIVSGREDFDFSSYTLSVTQNTGPPPCTTANLIASLPFTSPSLPLDPAVRSTPCSITAASVWFTYTPTFAHFATMSTCATASSIDTFLTISSGSCPFLYCIAGNIQSALCPANTGSVITDLLLTENTQYFITVTDGFTGITTGNIILTMTGNSVNDGCSQASVIDSLPFTTSHSTAFATQDFSCVSGSSTVDSNGADVWFSFTPSSNYGLVAISTCSSLSQFGVFVSSGSCASDQCVQSDTSSCPGGTSGYLQIPMQSGTTYFIAVSSMSASSSFTLSLSTPPTITCPANVSKVAIRSTCQYPGSTGTPTIGSSSGSVSVSKSPLPPYSIGIIPVTYTVTSNSDPALSASCVQTVTVTRPSGNYCS